MPLEVRELVIRGVVEGSQSTQQESETSDAPREERQQIVSDCVEQVLEILKNRQER
ncbi:hypothetical protein SAMN02745165_03130 [Malonomonas rubra DSM 5091]|uniref:Uncharacterized protein n=1 Tax=Malonomonas rubra DSM 5091 TaxID=1122189 RepID=A0A1M6M0C4_MALRU|nr:DUF5908 family protein [Malonomonas rubra]SHJ76969.1 hypothetical protein SAMN02745165_03130 [Malonomonas rubra DSM 5091]